MSEHQLLPECAGSGEVSHSGNAFADTFLNGAIYTSQPALPSNFSFLCPKVKMSFCFLSFPREKITIYIYIYMHKYIGRS